MSGEGLIYILSLPPRTWISAGEIALDVFLEKWAVARLQVNLNIKRVQPGIDAIMVLAISIRLPLSIPFPTTLSAACIPTRHPL